VAVRMACLHSHGAFSFQDSLIRPGPAVKRAKEFGYTGYSLTDHGTVAGVADHYDLCKKAGIIPLLGCEFYITPDAKVKDSENRKRDLGHITVYAINPKGVSNLFRLSSYSYLDGFYYKPRIDYKTLFEHQDGLIVNSGCLKNDVSQMIVNGADFGDVLNRVRWIRGNLGDRYYLELMPHGIPDQIKLNSALYQIHKLEKIPMVVSLDAHYLEPGDAKDQDLLMAMQMHTDLDEENRPHLREATYHLMPPHEVLDMFLKNHPTILPADVEQALENTARIADMVEDSAEEPLIAKNINLFPSYEETDEASLKLFTDLVEKCWDAKIEAKLIPHWSTPECQPYKDRLIHEMEQIVESGFYNYFLVVWDLIRFANEQKIPHGIGRGTVGSSLVAWLFGITGVDPIYHKLIFERFINPLRKDLPDIDMDFCPKRRDEVLQYIVKSYGEDKVAQIVTCAKRSPKSALKDVGRVMGIDFGTMNYITAAAPWDDYDSIKEALESDEKAQDLNRTYDDLFKSAVFFEGSLRQFGKHPAGVVISSKPLRDVVPLMRPRQDEDVIKAMVQFDKDTISRFGLIKMDILGLKTVTIIDDILKNVREMDGKTINLETLPLADSEVYKMIANGEVEGIFQLDKSSQLRALIRRIKPDRFQELHDIIALYRPSPIKGGMPELYCANRDATKRGEEKVYHPISVVNDILKDTYGTFIYQEQVMEIIHRAAGMSYGIADEFRKVMAKNKIAAEVKDAEVQKNYQTFIDGCVAHGLSTEQAEGLWATISKYTEYTFNRPHAVEYAMMSYWMAYLKHHHFPAFILAMFNSAEKDMEDIKRYILMASNHRVPIKLPLVNEAGERFGYDREGKLVWGFNAIKGVSENAIREITEKRPFNSLADMIAKIGSKRLLDRRVIRALYKAGSFTRWDDAETRQTYDKAYGKGEADKDLSDDYLVQEKEVFGVYLTDHPLRRYRKYLDNSRLMSQIDEAAIGGYGMWCGVIDSVMVKKAKKDGREFCILVVEDYNYARLELVMFNQAYLLHKDKLKEGAVIKFMAYRGESNLRFDDKGLFVVLSDKDLRLDENHKETVAS